MQLQTRFGSHGAALHQLWPPSTAHCLPGDLPAKTNRYIEEWSTRREHIENEFRWNARTLTNLALFAGAVPFLIYQARCVWAAAGPALGTLVGLHDGQRARTQRGWQVARQGRAGATC